MSPITPLENDTSTNKARLFYETHFKGGLMNGFLVAGVFIIVLMNIDRKVDNDDQCNLPHQ